MIYSKDALMSKLFSYNALAKKVAAQGKTGYRAKVLIETSLLPIETATLTAQPGDYKFTADKKGIILAEMPLDEYDFVLSAPGCVPITGVMKTHTGVMHRLNCVMAKAVVETMEVSEEKVKGEG